MPLRRAYLFATPYRSPRRVAAGARRSSLAPWDRPLPVQAVVRSATPNPDADAALLARLRAGDEAAYEQLVREQTPALLRVAHRLLRSEDDARDAVQDAFVAA